MNKVTVIGNLAADPESRIVDSAQGSVTVCNFTVATNRIVRGQKKADYFRVSCWRNRAENAMKYLKKGQKVAVIGPVAARAYLGNDGQPKAALEVQAEVIEYLGAKPTDAMAQSAALADENGCTLIDDDELPF